MHKLVSHINVLWTLIKLAGISCFMNSFSNVNKNNSVYSYVFLYISPNRFVGHTICISTPLGNKNSSAHCHHLIIHQFRTVHCFLYVVGPTTVNRRWFVLTLWSSYIIPIYSTKLSFCYIFYTINQIWQVNTATPFVSFRYNEIIIITDWTLF